VRADCLVEPSKLVALADVGDGRLITGTAMIIAAYATSVLLVERLFRIVKPHCSLAMVFQSVGAASCVESKVI
jgi:hypothetical protein